MDTWQVTHKLTVYIGSGWDYLPVPKRADRGIESYNSSNNTYQFCGVGGVSSTCGVTVQKTLFSPRFGIAYRVKPNTVFRAAYSLAPEQIDMFRDGLYNYSSTVTQTLNGASTFRAATTLAQGFPTQAIPNISEGSITLPTDIGVA